MFWIWIILGLAGIAVLSVWPRRARQRTGDNGSAIKDECKAEAYMMAHDFPRALAESERAIQLDPCNALSYFQRANAHHALGNLEQAVADYTTAINLHERG